MNGFESKVQEFNILPIYIITSLKDSILMRLLFFILLAVTFVAKLSHAQDAYLPIESSVSDTIQIVIAAEMRDITDDKQGRYGELMHLIETERKKVPTTFFLFGGASIGPSALSNLDRGSHIVDLLNSLEPDAMGVSKLDFSYDLDELSLRSYEAAFPIVTSNIIDTRINLVPDGLSATALIARNDTKLGFISVTDNRIVKEYLLNNIVVNPQKSVIETLARKLRSRGADIILLHYYDSFPEVKELLNENTIDYAFISNTRLRDSIKSELIENNKIFVLDTPGRAMVITLGSQSPFPIVSQKPIDLNRLQSNSLVSNQVNDYLQRLNRLLDDTIATWGDEYTTDQTIIRTKENAFANFVVDAMLEFSSADIALVNSGSFRGNKTYSKDQKITRRTIATELPFRSTLSLLKVTGRELREALENSVTGLDLLKGAFLQVSGIRVEFDSTAPIGNRVGSVFVGNNPIELDKEYKIATTDYLASGGDGYASLAAADKITEYMSERTILISDIVLQTLLVNGKLDSQIEGRLIDTASAQ